MRPSSSTWWPSARSSGTWVGRCVQYTRPSAGTTRHHGSPAACRSTLDTACPAPGRAEWPSVDREKDEYRRVTATGLFQHDRTVLVQAVTERGAGFWVVTPLVLADGSAILINRGFVPADRSTPEARLAGEIAAGPVAVTGLLRITEPGGAFLRSNDPAADRWFSRDVAAIAAAKGLADVAPYFIDADATPNPGGLPIGGLTVVAFRNSHLVYALTWYALAAMSAAAAWRVWRRPMA